MDEYFFCEIHGEVVDLTPDEFTPTCCECESVEFSSRDYQKIAGFCGRNDEDYEYQAWVDSRLDGSVA